jgi:hypothetical protein
MLGHLHQPDIDGLARSRVTVADTDTHRHLDECELCLRRLIDEVLRLASVESDGQTHAPALEGVASAAIWC